MRLCPGRGRQSLASKSAHRGKPVPRATDLVPFGDPQWYQDWASPYYNDSHRKVRAALRHFTDTYLTPNALAWDQAKQIPPGEYKRIAGAGILAGVAAGSTGWPSEYAQGIPVPGGIKPDEWDAFHNLIVIE